MSPIILYVCMALNSILVKFSLAGPPLTQDNAFAVLLAHNVTVGVGIEEQWSSRNIRFDIAWVCVLPSSLVIL